MKELLCHRRASRRQCALTLVETLLALSIGAMVVATTSTVAIQSVRAQQSARRTFNARAEKKRLLDQFEQDVSSLVTWAPELTEIITLGGDQGVLVALTSLVTTSDPAGVFARRAPARVTYRVAALDRERRQILREVDWFHPVAQSIGQQPPRKTSGTRCVLTNRVKSISIEAFYDNEWHAAVADKFPKQIEGIRIRGQWADDLSAFERVVALPGIKDDAPDERRRP